MLHHSCVGYSAVFVFTRHEEPFFTDEAVGLNQIARERPDVALFGLMAYSTADEVREFARQQQLSYPVLIDTDGSILRRLDVPRTPWNFIFDCSRQTLVYQGPAVENGSGVPEFRDKLLSIDKVTVPR